MNNNMDVYDFCVIITTYNRPNMLYNLLKSIDKEKKDFKFKIFVFNDCSSELYDLSSFDVTHIKIFPNRGKINFWQTINQAFKIIKNIDSKYYVFLQDDFDLCENFFKEIKNAYENLNDSKKISLEFLTDIRTTRPNWSEFLPKHLDNYIKTQWVELHFISEKKFFEVLDYTINPIPKSRWSRNPNLSSGVGQQLTERLIKLNYNMYHTKNSLVFHGEHISQMNPNERKLNKLITK